MATMSVLWDLLCIDLSDALPGGLASFTIDREKRDAIAPVGATVSQYAAAALLRSVPKKFQDEIDQRAADEAAFAIFNKMNDDCHNWRMQYELAGPFDETVIGEFKQCLWDFFNPEGFPLLDLADIEMNVDFGPGNAPGARSTAFLDKLGHSVLTAPNQLTIDLFDQWVMRNPTRIDCELARSLVMGSPVVDATQQIVAVPKTAKISRLVKTEPLLGMFYQKGIQAVLEGRLKQYFGIDLAKQPSINTNLARLGSIYGDYATIDLTSASDRISIGFCEEFIPRSSLLWLKAFRSKTAFDDQGDMVSLAMIATAGNAFCFPLETAIFACAVKATYKALGLPFSNRKTMLALQWDDDHQNVIGINSETREATWAVYGDDIVVREDAYETVTRLLRICGFLPNAEKSFSRASGSFRESCGGDFLHGTNVRGVYCKSLLTDQDLCVITNNLVSWSSSHGLLLKESIAYLRSEIKVLLEVPPWENPEAGLRVPLDCVTSPHVYRSKRHDRPNKPDFQGSYLYKRWLPKVASVDVSDEVLTNYVPPDHIGQGLRFTGPPRPVKLRVVCEGVSYLWNASAILLSAVKGALRGGISTARSRALVYHSRLGVAPCWDYIPAGTDFVKCQRAWYEYARVYFRSI